MPTISPQMENLFAEFLRRHREWRLLQKREMGWLTLVMILGLTGLTCFMYSVYFWGITLGLFFAFIVVFRHYLMVKKSSHHAYINVHILHHHLLGKLEVGFCDHQRPCTCAEDFKKYVWQHYRISLYGDPL